MIEFLVTWFVLWYIFGVTVMWEVYRPKRYKIIHEPTLRNWQNYRQTHSRRSRKTNYKVPLGISRNI